MKTIETKEISKPTPETSQEKLKLTKPEEKPTSNMNSTIKTKPEPDKNLKNTKPKKTSGRNPVQMDIRSLLTKKKLERVEKHKLMANSTNLSADRDILVHPSDQATYKPSSNNETSGAIMLGGAKTNSMVRNRVVNISKTSNVDKSDWIAAQKTEPGAEI